MPPVLQRTIREIHQRLRALETREYAEVVGPGSVINAQYLTLALHAVLTAERRFVDGDGLVGVDGGANADYTLNARHALLSTSHTDTLAAAVVDGDVIIGNVTPRWSRLAIAIPAANVRNVLGIDNAELRPSWKTALDNVNPADIAGAAAPGVSLIFSHRDHVHNHPAGLGVNLHHNEVHVVNSTGPHAEAGLAVGNVLRASGAAAFAFAQLQHGDLGGVGVNDHHNEVHVVNSTGPHAEAGLTIGHVLRASAAAAFAFAQLQHGDLGGVGVNDHHTQIHDVVGGDHTLIGAQWNLVGATALNTIGLLLALDDVSAPAEAILKSTAAGGLTLVDLTLTNNLLLAAGSVVGISPGNVERIVFSADSILVYVPAAATDPAVIQLEAWSGLTAGSLTLTVDSNAAIHKYLSAAVDRIYTTGDIYLDGDLAALGQLSAGAGIAEGIILGADAQWYRSAANMLRTPDSVTIDVGLNIGTVTGAGPGAVYASDFFFSQRPNVADFAFASLVGVEPLARYVVFADGTINWGSGAAARDTNFYRSAANMLQTDDSLTIGIDEYIVGAHRQSISIGARVYRDAVFVHNNTGNWVTIDFNQQRWDDPDDDQWVIGTPTRLTCQFDGIYVITGHVNWDANATGRRHLSIYLNGATNIAVTSNLSLTADSLFQSIATTYKLSATEFVELRGWQNSGGNLNISSAGNYSPEFSMVRVA